LVHLPDALAHCLELIGSGKADVEGCMEMYPQWKEELGPLLTLALCIRSLPEESSPPSDYVQRTKMELVRAIEKQQNAIG
jgi:hypothetical protein